MERVESDELHNERDLLDAKTQFTVDKSHKTKKIRDVHQGQLEYLQNHILYHNASNEE